MEKNREKRNQRQDNKLHFYVRVLANKDEYTIFHFVPAGPPNKNSCYHLVVVVRQHPNAV